MEIPTSVVASELWLRDDLEGVYALLFRFLGFGFRLAMSSGLARDAEVRHSAGAVSASLFFSFDSVWDSPLPHARVGVF